MKAFPWRGLFVVIVLAATHASAVVWLLALGVFWIANGWTIEFDQM